MNEQLFYVGLKAFIERDRKLLIIRSKQRQTFELPGGRIDEQETEGPFETTLTREIREELGAEIRVAIGEPFTAWKLLLPNKNPILLVGFHCTYEGGSVQLAEEFDQALWIAEDEISQYPLLKGSAEVIENWFTFRDQHSVR